MNLYSPHYVICLLLDTFISSTISAFSYIQSMLGTQLCIVECHLVVD